MTTTGEKFEIEVDHALQGLSLGAWIEDQGVFTLIGELDEERGALSSSYELHSHEGQPLPLGVDSVTGVPHQRHASGVVRGQHWTARRDLT